MIGEAHNQFAGQGAVVLDIGDDIGALVLIADATLAGVEIEARPVEANRPLVHVAVLPRPTPSGTVHAAVFGALLVGDYELYCKPDGPVALRTSVRGGEVTQLDWPGQA